MIRHRSPAVVAVLAAVLLAGCTDGSADTSAAPGMRPTSSPSPELRPADPAPKDFRMVTGDGFSLRAPSAYQSTTTRSRTGQPTLVLTPILGDRPAGNRCGRPGRRPGQ